MHFVLGTLFGFLVAVGGVWGVFFWLGRDDLQYERMTGTSLARSRTILWCLLNYRRRAEPVTRNGGRRRPSPYYVRVPEEPILPQLNRETTSAGCDSGVGFALRLSRSLLLQLYGEHHPD